MEPTLRLPGASLRARLAPAVALLLGLLLACAGPGPSQSAGGTTTATTPDAGRLSSDVYWLADDARDGRRAGTAGEQASAKWIAERLATLGVQPKGEDGYRQPFPIDLPARDGGGSTLTLHPSTPAGAQAGAPATVFSAPGVAPLSCAGRGSAAGPLVFAGFGIVLPENGWDDYAGLDVKGAVVAVVRGTPPDERLTAAPAAEGQEAEEPSWGSRGGIFHKVMEAKRRGAVAVLLLPRTDESAGPALAYDPGQLGRAGIPALSLSGATADRVVPGWHDRAVALAEGREAERGPVGIGGGATPATVAVQSDVVFERGTASNVLGLIPGTDHGRVVVVGAHFDHLGHGGPGSLAPGVDAIHNGADDNASGTASVLEVARLLEAGPPPPCDVLVALWSGEEEGLLGSEHWTEHPTVPLDRVVANVNLDMVGRAGAGVLQVLGAGTAKEFKGMVETAAADAGLEVRMSLSGQGIGGSDHQSFLRKGIPALHLFSGIHPDYHKPSDDADRFEADGAARVTTMALDLVEAIAAAGRLAYVEPPAEEPAGQRRTRGFRTRFGSVPDYAYDGPGMRLSGTSANSPAERSGLLAGDVLTRIDDVPIETIYDFMYVLNAHKPGDTVLVHFTRDGKEETTRVTLASAEGE